MKLTFDKNLADKKTKFRRYMKNLSPTEKIIHLENLQRNYYEILENNGRPIPIKWQKWNAAQKRLIDNLK